VEERRSKSAEGSPKTRDTRTPEKGSPSPDRNGQQDREEAEGSNRDTDIQEQVRDDRVSPKREMPSDGEDMA